MDGPVSFKMFDLIHCTFLNLTLFFISGFFSAEFAKCCLHGI